MGQLAALVKTRIKQMEYRLGLIDGFLAKTGLNLTPLVTRIIEDLSLPSGRQTLGLFEMHSRDVIS